MPSYVYECSSCGQGFERTLKVSERHTHKPTCCGDGEVRIVLQPPKHILGSAPFESYRCPVTDTIVESKRQRQEIMKRHDLIEQPQIKSGEY